MYVCKTNLQDLNLPFTASKLLFAPQKYLFFIYVRFYTTPKWEYFKMFSNFRAKFLNCGSLCKEFEHYLSTFFLSCLRHLFCDYPSAIGSDHIFWRPKSWLWCCVQHMLSNRPTREYTRGRLPFVRTDWPDHSRRKENNKNIQPDQLNPK